MDSLGTQKGLEVNVDEIMAGIRAKVQEESPWERNPDCLFDQEIDVAGIMRDIRHEISGPKKIDSLEFRDMAGVGSQLRDIYAEIARINSFAVNTSAEANMKVDPGCVIPVAVDRPRFIQKIFTIIKRLIRKATRFLMLDQKVYNEKMSACVKALCESQEQVLKLTKLVATLTSDQARIQSDSVNAAGRLDELYGFAEKQMKFQTQVQADTLSTAEKLNELYGGIKRQAEELNELYDRVAQQAEELRREAEAQTETDQAFRQQTGELRQQIEAFRQRLEALSRQGDMFSASVAKTILEYRQEAGLPIEALRSKAPASQAESEDGDTYTVLDYFKFQNNFRGTRALITERQEMYLPYFKDSREPVLDIGCGRGEFLSLMKANKIPAFGVDMYPEYVIEGGMNGLDVRLGDGIEFLQNAKQSFGGIFVCQVIEHISFTQLQTLCAAAYEKLVPGGYLILETPNPRCLSIYTNGFYIDPTHDKPVHPLMLQYLVGEIGFEDVKIEYTECSRERPLPQIQSDEIKNLDQINEGIARVSNMLFGSQDYAVIARKP